MMSISPDGDTIAYWRTTADDDTILIVSLVTGKPVGGITLSATIDPTDMLFVNDETIVLVVSQHTRIAGFRGDHDVSSAYVYNTKDGKVARLLSPGGVVYVGQTSLGSIIGVSADGRYVYMPGYSGDATFVDHPNFSIFRVGVDNPKTSLRVLFPGERRSRDFLVDRKGEAFAHEIFNDREGVHTIEVRQGAGEWKEIYRKETDLRRLSLVGTTTDGESLVVGMYDADARYRSYYTMSRRDGTMADKLFGNDSADVERVLTDLNRVVYGARYSGFHPAYEFLDEKLTARLSAIVSEFDGNSVRLRDWTPDWKKLIVFVEGPAYSGQYFEVTESGEIVLLANARLGFDDSRIHPVVEFAFPAADGLRIPALLTAPRDRADSLEKLPAVMLPHGGPGAYDSIGFDWMAQALADRGYLVIQPQFRGSRGFGLDHYLAGRGEWGAKMQSDLADGLAVLVRQGYVDPDRVCIVGSSYGGYAALAGGAFTPGLYRCVVSINGVSDLDAMIRHKDFEYQDNEWIVAYFKQTIGGGELDNDRLDAISPAFHADAFEAPVLLIHAEDDEVVSEKQSRRMYSQLRRAGKEVRFVSLEDEGHYLSSNRTRIRALREIIDFVDEHLQ